MITVVWVHSFVRIHRKQVCMIRELNLPRRAAVVRLCMPGNPPDKNDIFYGKFVIDQVVTIVHRFESGLFLTNKFIPELINENNDYCYHGFIIVDRQMIEFLDY